MRYDDIDPRDIDPETNRPYAGYSSPALDDSFHRSEAAVVAREAVEDARFERWTQECERLLNIKTLDGDFEEDGYCLDFALDAFEDRRTPAEYAETVRREWDARAEGQ